MTEAEKLHNERVKQELAEQEKLLAKVQEDSDRHDAELEKRAASSAKPSKPDKPVKGENDHDQ